MADTLTKIEQAVCFTEGRLAARGREAVVCPYRKGSESAKHWLRGVLHEKGLKK